MTVIFAICVVVCSVTYNICYNHCQAAETAKLWCPVCKRGDLREAHNLIYCTLCKLRLDLGEDKVVCICVYAGCLYKLFGKRQLGNLIVSICPPSDDAGVLTRTVGQCAYGSLRQRMQISTQVLFADYVWLDCTLHTV
jgi:hypothetical protein